MIPSHKKEQRLWMTSSNIASKVESWSVGLPSDLCSVGFTFTFEWAPFRCQSMRYRLRCWTLGLETNVPIMLWARGMIKLMAVPHLFIWGPLQWLLLSKITQISGADAMPPLELIYVSAVLLVNGISLAFDTLDSWCWLKRDRAVPGMRV